VVVGVTLGVRLFEGVTSDVDETDAVSDGLEDPDGVTELVVDALVVADADAVADGELDGELDGDAVASGDEPIDGVDDGVGAATSAAGSARAPSAAAGTANGSTASASSVKFQWVGRVHHAPPSAASIGSAPMKASAQRLGRYGTCARDAAAAPDTSTCSVPLPSAREYEQPMCIHACAGTEPAPEASTCSAAPLPTVHTAAPEVASIHRPKPHGALAVDGGGAPAACGAAAYPYPTHTAPRVGAPAGSGIPYRTHAVTVNACSGCANEA
jgi:hypothetical protein